MYPALDLLIRGNHVIPIDTIAHNFANRGGQIMGAAAHSSIPAPEGSRLVDVTGEFVSHGGIDPHVHCPWPMPGPEGQLTLLIQMSLEPPPERLTWLNA